MDRFFRRLAYTVFVLVLLAGTGIGAGVAGYYYGRDEAENETTDKLEKKYEDEIADLEAERDEEEEELRDFYENQIRKLENQLEGQDSTSSDSDSEEE